MFSKCFHCNGYYGNSFGQPLCSTCHMFLYADEATLHSTRYCPDKVDDGDSGNEEEREPSDGPIVNSPGNNACKNSKLMPESQVRDEDAFHQNQSDGASNSQAEMSPRMDTGAEANENVLSTPNAERFEVNLNWMEIHPDETEFSHSSESAIEKLPPEILLIVFRLLDEVSLWSVGQVCRHWNKLVSGCMLNEQWKVFTQRRWPLFMPLYNVVNWHKIFVNLIESAPCQMCLLQMPYNTNPPANENSWRRNRLCSELRTLRSDPPEGISASPLDKSSLHWQASIRGPAGSPYQGGTFFLYIQIPSTYPLEPPLVRFITRIFHPNVSCHGDIGIDSIQHNWSLALTISKVLISIQSLLTDPYTKVCMEPRIGELYNNNRIQFERIARGWTWRYALHDAIDPESMIPEYLPHLTSEGGLLQKARERKEAEEIPSEETPTQQTV